MRCYICDTYLPDPEFDDNHKSLPCPECSGIIYDAVYDDEEFSFEDEEEVEEDEDELP